MHVKRMSYSRHQTNSANGLRGQLVSAIVFLILVFSITTIIQSLVDAISINKIIGGILAVLSGWLFLLNPESKFFFRFAYFILKALFSFLISASISTEVNDFIFLFTTLLMLMTISNERNTLLFQKALNRHKKIINLIIISECFFLTYLLISKTGYSYHWGGDKYFKGMCNSQHTMGSLSCLIISFLLFLANEYKHNYVMYGLLSIIPAYAIFETGARVFLIPLMILFFFFIQYGFKERIVRIIIYIVGIALALFFLLNSAMIDKFSFVSNNTYVANSNSSFTSGRTEFWIVDLELYFSGNAMQLLFGRTFRDVYVTNLQKVNMEIWAHNDIIHLLVGTGMIGALAYIVVLYSAIVKAKKNVKNKKIYFMLVFYVVIPMLLNGFFIYQHFLYSFIILYFIVITKEGGLER